MGVLSTSMDSSRSSRRRFTRESSQPEEETKDGASSAMAIDDVAIGTSSKSEISTGDCCETRSARNSSEIDSPIGGYSRASSLLTDLTECLSESSNTSSNNSSSSTTRLSATPPAYAHQQQQQQPPLRTVRPHLFKSSSSFQLSGYHGRPQGLQPHAAGSFSNCCVFGHQACCQLAKHHNNFGANHSPLSPLGNHVQAHHHCAGGGQVPSTPALKMGHFQVGSFGAHFGGNILQRQLHCGGGSSQALVQHQHQQSGHHQGGSATFALGGSFHPPTRSASSAGITSMAGAGGSCGCFSNCCCCCHNCDSRQCRKQQSPTSSVNIHGSHEGLMSQGGHPMDNLPHPPSESGPPPLTAEGLSWRRLHMSRAKLKATATTSELLSGFAMVAMVELQINEPTNVPEWLFVLFAVCTTVLVSVHIFALMISTYILPNVDAVSKMQQCNQGEIQSSHGYYRKHSYSSSTTFSSSGSGGDAAVLESPHERMRGFIELAWAFSTVLGLFLFLVELAILCWVKFWDHSFTAAWAATVIVIPVLVLFLAFAAHFYHSLVAIKCDTSASDMRDLERMKADLDAAARDASAASNV